ncbi:MAG: efflux RND transporter periplasmic adaptor subunit [Burkholderiaceae bacterium]
MALRLVRWLVLLLVLAVIGGWALMGWRGPLLPAYRVVSAPLQQNVVATGRVAAVSSAKVGSEVVGVVRDVYVEEGDVVAAGQVLVQLRDDDPLARVREGRAALEHLAVARRPQAEARLRQAQARLEQAQREAQRRKVLLAANAIPRESKEQADQALATAQADAEQVRLEVQSLQEGQTEEIILRQRLLAAEAALQKTTLRAGSNGTVVRRQVEPGDLVQPGAVLLEVARAGEIEIIVPVDERNLNVLALDQPAVVIPDAYPDRAFDARVKEIAPAIDPQRGTVDVRLRIADPPDYLRTDMTVTATVRTGEREAAIVVPNDALGTLPSGDLFVWQARDGRARRVPVQTGLRGVAFTEITQGLQAGDTVVLGTGLDDGQRIRTTPLDRAAPASQGPSVRRETPMKFN